MSYMNSQTNKKTCFLIKIEQKLKNEPLSNIGYQWKIRLNTSKQNFKPDLNHFCFGLKKSDFSTLDSRKLLFSEVFCSYCNISSFLVGFKYRNSKIGA